MAEIINLNRVRKQRARDAANATADANRAKFGQSKAQKDAAAAEYERVQRALDDAKLD